MTGMPEHAHRASRHRQPRAPIAEAWKPIPGYEGLYDVSDLGRVRSWRGWNARPRPDILVGTTAKGYRRVALCRDGVSRRFFVHRLVLVAFVGPPAEDQECRHLDGDPLNNTLPNLAWGTHAENNQDRVRHGTHSQAAKTHCPQGHAYDAENTAQERRGRKCRACHRERQRQRRIKLIDLKAAS